MDKEEGHNRDEEDPRVTGEPRLWFLALWPSIYPGGTPFSLVRWCLESQQHNCFANMEWNFGIETNQEYLAQWAQDYLTTGPSASCRSLENYILLKWKYAYCSTFFMVNDWHLTQHQEYQFQGY